MVRFANPVLVGAPCAPFPSTAASRPTMSLLAIDLGGTKLASALFSSSGDLLQRDVAPGIGVGLLVDGRVLRGHGDIAGGIGWLAVRQPHRVEYTACGCLEHHASGPGLLKVARERYSTTADLFAAYDAADPLAIEVLDDAVGLWGMMAANLVSLFNPEILVFGGGVFWPAARFLDRIRAEAACWAQPISMGQVRFVPSALGG